MLSHRCACLIEATNMTVTDDGVDAIDGSYENVDDGDEGDERIPVEKRGGGRRRNMKYDEHREEYEEYRRVMKESLLASR